MRGVSCCRAVLWLSHQGWWGRFSPCFGHSLRVLTRVHGRTHTSGDAVPVPANIERVASLCGSCGSLPPTPPTPRMHQAYAAGFLEATLSQRRLYEVAVNNAYAGGAYPANVTQFLTAQRAWVEAQVAASPNDPYWFQGKQPGPSLARPHSRAVP